MSIIKTGFKNSNTRQKHWHVYEVDNLYYGYLVGSEGLDYAEMIKRKCLINKAFSYYCGGNTGIIINEILRFGMHSDKLEHYMPYIKTIEDEISNYDLQENIIAFRTLDYIHLLVSQNRKNIKVGDIVEDKGFMGVGLVKDCLLKAHPNYDTVIKVFIPSGCNAIYLDFISERNDEQEVLIQKNSQLKVLYNRYNPIKKKRFMECDLIINSKEYGIFTGNE